MIIARNRKVQATVSNSDFEEIKKAGSASGGGSLFGIFGGGGKKKWSTKNVTTTSNGTSFTVEADGIAVIGVVSQVVPLCPDPNVTGNTWPSNALLPQ
jgi:hypothetical protein